MTRKYTKYITLAVAVLLVGLDQFTKWLAVNYIKPQGTIPLITVDGKQWLNLTYQENSGAAFSILQDKQLFLIIITSVILVGILVLFFTGKIKRTEYLWAFSVILAGGTGNLIDRVFNGFVVDFIDVRIINFAVFNVADICAVCGAIMLFVFVCIDEVKASRAEKAKKAAIPNETDNVEKNDEQI